MAGGIDKYYQFAKCFRDEALGADRQPEFTQIDLEMAFCNADDVKEVTEKIVAEIWRATKDEDIRFPFKRLTYNEAMRKYGSDKPDIRFDLEIVNLTERIHPKQKAVDDTVLEALVIPGGGKHLSRKDLQELKETVLADTFPLYGGKMQNGDLDFAVITEGILTSQSLSLPSLRGEAFAKVNAELKLSAGDTIFLNRRQAGYRGGSTPMGRLRLLAANYLKRKGALVLKSRDEFLWVEQFPLFSPSAEDRERTESTHHPFTAPMWEDSFLVINDPMKARAQHYDLVLNGQEIGGGSIRIHDPKMQHYVMKRILGMDSSRIQANFGHLLNALSYGCPPHGGLALGFDRIMAIVCQEDSIRDVIAFPKLSGGDLFANSPSHVPEDTLKMYHINVDNTTA
ncbi:hypothetical protein HDU96_007126 [Phlyctochytrium bullatum]|nr:hypothetical protein HDU96_007126 [Phlyctochytrium bullatum]